MNQKKPYFAIFLVFFSTALSASVEKMTQKIIGLAESENVPGMSVIVVKPDKQVSLTHYGVKRKDRPGKVDDKIVYTLRSEVWNPDQYVFKLSSVEFGLHRLPTKSLLLMEALKKGTLRMQDTVLSLYQDYPQFSSYVGWKDGLSTIKQYMDDDRLKEYSLMAYDFESLNDFKKGFRFVDILVHKMGYEDTEAALQDMIFGPLKISLPSPKNYQRQNHAIPHELKKGEYQALWGYLFEDKFNFSIQDIAKFYAHYIPKVLKRYQKETDHLIYRRVYEKRESERWMGWRVYAHEERKIMVFDDHVFVDVQTGNAIIFMTNINNNNIAYRRFKRKVLDLLLMAESW
jgi:hypothetical protein